MHDSSMPDCISKNAYLKLTVINFTDTTNSVSIVTRSKSATNGGSIQENIKKMVEEQQILENLNIMSASDKVIKKFKKDSAKMWAELQPELPDDDNFWIKTMAYGLRGYFVTLNITEMPSGGGDRTGGSGRARAKLEEKEIPGVENEIADVEPEPYITATGKLPFAGTLDSLKREFAKILKARKVAVSEHTR
jgi:hypothetical protein